MKFKGSCHCGKIAFEVECEMQPAIECNCSHCSRKGYLLWFVPKAQFSLLTPARDLATYTFNRHVIQHRFCPTCGCAPFGEGKDKTGNATAAVNVRCIPEVDLGKLERKPFDGRRL